MRMIRMRFLFKLLPAKLKDRIFAVLLIVLATAACSALIASVGGVYKLAGDRIHKKVAKVMGKIDRIIISGTMEDWQADKTRYGAISPQAALEPHVIQTVVNHSSIASSWKIAYAKVEVFNPRKQYSGNMYHPGHTMILPIIAMSDDKMPPSFLAPGLTKEDWENCVKNDFSLFPLSKGWFGRVRYKKGDEILVSCEKKAKKIKIGATYKAIGRVRNFGGMFVSKSLFQKLTGEKFRVNRIYVDLGQKIEKSKAQSFDKAFHSCISKANLPVTLLTQEDYIEEMVEDQMRYSGGFGLLPFSGTILTIIGAFFIILYSVGMGNLTQIKESRELKAMGVPAKHLTVLVILEAVIPALIGCTIGLIITRILYGLGLQSGRRGFSFAKENISSLIYYRAIFQMMPYCFVITITSTLVAICPVAYQIWKKHPLEKGKKVSSTFTYRRWILVAILLLANPAVTILPGISKSAQLILVPVTYATTLVGLLLSLPFLTTLYRKLFCKILSTIFRLRYELVENFLRIHSGKIVAGTAAMLIGLGLFVATLIWGHSMKIPFLLTEKSPDASVVSFPKGFTTKQIEEIAKQKGIQKLVPLHLHHPTISDAQASKKQGIFSDWRDLLYIGCNIRDVFGKEGILYGKIVRGDQEKVFENVAQGKGCIITAGLHRKNPKIYDLGKNIEIQKIGSTEVILHKIVGIIDIPGWHLFTKSARMRRGLGRLSGLVFVSPKTLLKNYPKSLPRCFWLKVDESKLSITKNPQPPRGGRGRRRRGRHKRQGRARSKPKFAGPKKGKKRSVESIFQKYLAKTSNQSKTERYLRVVNIREMTKLIKRRCTMVIGFLSLIPFLALLLSSIAIAATVAGSIQARQKEIGILRSIGISRSQLFCLILIESITMVMVATFLGILFGFSVSWSGTIVSAGTWGVHSPYIIPWKLVLLGCVISIITGISGSILPAFFVSRKSPYSLLRTQDEL